MNYAMAEGVWVTQGRWIRLGRERLNQAPPEPVQAHSRKILILRSRFYEMRSNRIRLLTDQWSRSDFRAAIYRIYLWPHDRNPTVKIDPPFITDWMARSLSSSPGQYRRRPNPHGREHIRVAPDGAPRSSNDKPSADARGDGSEHNGGVIIPWYKLRGALHT